jgi:hypothetical protein
MKLKFLLIPALFFAGCSSPNVEMPTISFPDFDFFKGSDSSVCKSEPEWVLHPPFEKNSVYGIGIAPRHFKGEQAQRKSAMSKAIQEIASQMNTTVNSQLVSRAAIHNKHASKSMSSISFQTVNGQQVSANIVKSCKNPDNGYLYILMKADSK